MKDFLHSVAEDLYKIWGDSLENVTILSPNRRAGIILKKNLAEVAAKPVWSPLITTPKAWAENLSSLAGMDKLEGVLTLWNITNRSITSEWEPSQSLSFCERLYKLFDLLDLYFITPEKLFFDPGTLIFEGEEELLNSMKKLQQSLKDASENLRSPYEDIWPQMPGIYKELKKTLSANGYGYDGMIFRNVLEKNEDFISSGEKMAVIGFDLLNKAETELFKLIKNRANARFYWNIITDDSDKIVSFYDHTYYDRNDDASLWKEIMLKNLKAFPPSIKFSNYQPAEKLEIVSAPGQLHEIQYVWSQLSEKDNAAIILLDEQILPYVISTIPDHIKKYNISMGKDLSQSMVMLWIFKYLEIRKEYIENPSVVNSDLLRELFNFNMYDDGKEVYDWRSQLKNKRGIIKIDESEDQPYKDVFCRQETNVQFIEKLRQQVINRYNSEEDSWYLKKELLEAKKLLDRALKFFNGMDHDPGIYLIKKILFRLSKITRIFFRGEPMEGIQIMGLLEARNLSFDKVFLIHANEDFLPPSVPPGLLPMSISRAAGLPGPDELQSSYAYYFDTILRSCGNLSTTYADINSEGALQEKSRYLFRIEKTGLPRVKYKTISSSIVTDKEYQISFSSTPDEETILKRIEKGISPSAIISFLQCPLQYFNKYHLALYEPDKRTTSLEINEYGKIYHKALNYLYNPYKGDTYGSLNPDELKKRSKDAVDKALQEEKYYLPKELLVRGELILKRKEIELLIEKALEKNHKECFNRIIWATEEKLRDSITLDDRKVTLTGIVDRVDKINNAYFIIDYKLSAVGTQKKLEKIKENIHTQNNQYSFQLYFYGYLYKRKYPDATIKMYNIPFHKKYRHSNDGYKVLKMTEELMGKFEDTLKDTLKLMLKPTLDITQTSNMTNCRFCSYNIACNRIQEVNW